METFYKLNTARKQAIFNLAAVQTGLPESAIEKDWWVTMVLKAIFSLPYANHIVFKRGTSLSKGWKLIDRFSEDIDLALDRTFLGLFEGDLSKKQVTRLRQASYLFISNGLLNDLKEKITAMGITGFNLFAWESTSSDTDPATACLPPSIRPLPAQLQAIQSLPHYNPHYYAPAGADLQSPLQSISVPYPARICNHITGSSR